LLKCIGQRLAAQDFIELHRRDPRAFIRKRLLDFARIVLLLTRVMISSLQRELDSLFEQLGLASQSPTASAFCKARLKLRHSAFIELQQITAGFFYQHCPVVRRWCGLVVTAVDGSTASLPRVEALEQAFGGMQPRLGAFRPKARVLERFDVLNGICWHALLAPYAQGERTLLAEHQRWIQTQEAIQLRPEEVVTLYDRGFASFELLDWCQQNHHRFVLRLPTKAPGWIVARDFLATGKAEAVVEVATEHHVHQLRLVRVDRSGEDAPAVLITNLMDTASFPLESLQELYGLRWGVENAYKIQKCRAQLENWSGQSEEAIRQDFHAKVFATTLCAALAARTDEALREHSQQQLCAGLRKFAVQLNQTQALGSFRRLAVGLLLGLGSAMRKTLGHFLALLRRCACAVRPGRHLPRPTRSKAPPASAYKSI
jgi:hypothetical protein